jgi:hypothetical protein
MAYSRTCEPSAHRLPLDIQKSGTSPKEEVERV